MFPSRGCPRGRESFLSPWGRIVFRIFQADFCQKSRETNEPCIERGPGEAQLASPTHQKCHLIGRDTNVQEFRDLFVPFMLDGRFGSRLCCSDRGYGVRLGPTLSLQCELPSPVAQPILSLGGVFEIVQLLFHQKNSCLRKLLR